MGNLASVLKDHSETATHGIPRDKLSGNIVWTRASLKPSNGLVRLNAKAAAELDDVVRMLRDNPLPIEFLEPSMFRLDACRDLMDECRSTLENGVGFAIIDRLPMDKYSRLEAKAAYWILSQLLSRPVAQSWDGKVIYDVRDFGKAPGNGVRPDITNAEQNFHTDNSYNICPPDYVALLCLQTAKEGGVSSIVSFYTVLNEMLERRPDLVDRLFAPYLFDRQKEHAPDSPPVISHPMMQMDHGSILCRLSHRHVINGYKMAGIELDPVSEDALETLESIMREPEFIREFFFEPGQIQIVDNRRLGHRRSGFVDYEEEDKKRHLVRLWLRREGRRYYNG
ncbi:TauD/TfdA family dioxygenase [Alcaligenaceae bacterium]|nr:TauD/TfdA family dioxygenase [Alcaligenaceae bacterium]